MCVVMYCVVSVVGGSGPDGDVQEQKTLFWELALRHPGQEPLVGVDQCMCLGSSCSRVVNYPFHRSP